MTARDAAGNSATGVLTVTYNAPDTTAPVVAIAQPTSASTFPATTATVNVSGTSSDAVGVTQVTWANDRGGSGTAAGTTSWSVNGVALQSGANVITITARDAAGNTATDTLTITFTAPLSVSNLTANLAAPQLVGTPITFTATATNGTAPYSYKWWLFDGTSWSILQNWSASNTYTWTPSVANSGFRVGVWVRSAGSTADAYDNPQSNVSIAFAVNPAPAPTPIVADQSDGEPVRTAAGRDGDHVHRHRYRRHRAISVQVVCVRWQIVDGDAELVHEQYVDLDADIGWPQDSRRGVGPQCRQHGRCV